jgi:transcriptional regulator with XRE-family HTH domain
MSIEPTILLAAQCRAARALAEWSLERLAQACSVDIQTLKEFEARFRRPDPETLGRIRGALTDAGVVFVDENGGGAGARLKLSRKELRALSRWEGEGGALDI